MKQTNDITYVPYDGAIVAAVDKLLELNKAAGFSQTVTSDAHWDVIEKILDIFATLYPKETADFKVYTARTRKLAGKAISKEQGGAMLQAQIEIPQKLYQMILAVFPQQKFDKQFVAKFAARFPAMKTTEATL